ncbi:ER membrane protein complex subunit 1 isoform X2 [Chrysoperla carnea]|uniref:ER membrane protein complex subunit 1 isoform X2 n=1 Tax=Chrysoperla carnea TaxID=189513 RepID=UPI001D0784CE|nr:ER membrane protein complex subunit 1 isoform X2 [Chrysoperla carnea]
MELSRWRLKGNNFSFMTDLQFFQYLFILFGLFNLSVCLFEDQIGKFDWKQNYVGKLKLSQFDTVSTAKRIIVVTEENVVAALHLKTGQIIWRQVLESANRSQIDFLHVDSEVITISAFSLSGPYLVRGWEPISGGLLWEWTFTLAKSTDVKQVDWLISHGRLYQVVAKTTGQDSYLEVTSYNTRTGQNRGSSARIQAPWISDSSKCILSNPHYICLNSQKIISVDVVSESNLVYTFPLVDAFENTENVELISVNGPLPIVILKQGPVHKFIKITEQRIQLLNDEIHGHQNFLVMPYGDDYCLLQANLRTPELLEISGTLLSDFSPIDELSSKIAYPKTQGVPILSSSFCSTRKDKGVVCRFFLSTEDEAMVLLQNGGKIIWTREESLANIISVDLLDLPVSDLDASIEKEFDNKANTNIFDMLQRRLTSQISQLQALLLTVFGITAPQSKNQAAGLVRDEFGLHKMIVVATRIGKVFGIDNKNGDIIWQQRLENIKPFTLGDKQSYPLFVQRTTRHFPHPAQCTLLARDQATNEGVIFTFNPITGLPINGIGPIRLGYRLKQLMLLPEGDNNALRGILLLDENNNVHITPESAIPVVRKMLKQIYLFSADYSTGLVSGYSVAFNSLNELKATQTWRLKLSGRGQQIIDVVVKNPLERVHSQGRVLADRSVLFKYINPNLVAIATQAMDPVHRQILSIYLIDVVSGSVIFSVTHKRARGPIHIVHSENWLTYCYFNDKWRRTEIATLELYEGKVQSNSTAFSSLNSPKLPMIERQAYIMPATILTMKETITEKGITSKHILMALSNGGILEMPWMFLDPRRPVSTPPEEGVVPYIPELPVPSEAMLNYNQSLSSIRGIQTVPSGLESTSLVFAYGLDIFYTRVAPSKTFDVLKDDFDYYLITLVLLGLTAASYITRYLASRKALKQAWK